MTDIKSKTNQANTIVKNYTRVEPLVWEWE